MTDKPLMNVENLLHETLRLAEEDAGQAGYRVDYILSAREAVRLLLDVARGTQTGSGLRQLRALIDFDRSLEGK